MSWVALAQGADIAVSPGDTLAEFVSVHKDLTRSRLEQAMRDHLSGLVLDDYAEQGERPNLGPDPDPDRKVIALKAHSVSYAGTLSWSKSIFLVAPDLYTIVQAWKAPAGSVAPASLPVPAAPPLTPRPKSAAGPWIAVAALLGLGGWVAYKSRDRLRALLVRG